MRQGGALLSRVVVIPARGGSKRIPGKNTREFCGAPIIKWSIDAARASGLFDRVLVSTDDPVIAEMARGFGAEAPFLRPKKLSDDFIGTGPVVAHAIQWLRSSGEDPDPVCCLYATAPFVTGADLITGLELLEREEAEFALSVTTFPFPVQRALRVREDGRVEMLHPENFSRRSQDLEETCHDAGQFYWGRAHAWLSGEPLFQRDAVPVVLPRHRVQDIDTPEDWVRAEWLFRAQVQDTAG